MFPWKWSAFLLFFLFKQGFHPFYDCCCYCNFFNMFWWNWNFVLLFYCSVKSKHFSLILFCYIYSCSFFVFGFELTIYCNANICHISLCSAKCRYIERIPKKYWQNSWKLFSLNWLFFYVGIIKICFSFSIFILHLWRVINIILIFFKCKTAAYCSWICSERAEWKTFKINLWLLSSVFWENWIKK